ncbi:MAG: transposase, partial [Colwellia sp.]
MKFNTNSLPNDPEQLKQMLLELQQRMESELAEKDVAYQQLLERYNLKLANEYGKKSEKMPGADEVFNEVELVLDEHDKKLLTDPLPNATTKTKPKRKPLPAELPRKEVIVD